ncbi:hybrid sensor histidine kinase/response regulator transcription factor [Parabacteroides sp. PF5-6]|uniref:hybrid sensor histidine kinase/response regulator transcription factor n=1 Tax=Parabacteroides sp. PF5-6 TaxID=1742403 RepID=UPI0024051ED1|nr:hybrid sensor histidine kinase/response regulator transcription factor [Parabacteroides sp. PF5-6]
MRKLLWNTLAVLCLISFKLSAGQSLSYTFEQLSIQDGLPTNEVNSIFQDSDGFIWLATRGGLCQYDGYSIRTFKSNLYTPGLLNNNNVYSLTEDADKQLWIGTSNGLNVLDKRTGTMRKIVNESLRESLITRILFPRSGGMLIATEGGVEQYDPATNTCTPFLPDRLVRASIKELMEDSRGNIWFGTWAEGLHRYDPATDQLYTYPQLSKENSSQAVFEDSRQRIWVGTWDNGLYCIQNPYEPEKLDIRSYTYAKDNPQSLADRYVFSISEDLNTGMIWVGTRNGLSILEDEATGRFRNYVPDNSASAISYNVVQFLLRDRQGLMWIATLGGGVNYVVTENYDFGINTLSDFSHEFVHNPSIRSVLVAKNGLIWLGLGNLGFLIYNRITGKYVYNMESEEFGFIGRIPTVNTIVQSPTTGKIWIGTYDWGIVEYDETAPRGKRARLLNRDACPWVNNQCIFSILEDSKGNTWFGTRNGISILKADGEGINLSNLYAESTLLFNLSIVAMQEDRQGNIWAATSNGGIIRITGDPAKADELQFKKYIPEKNNLNSVTVSCLFIDKQQRLWAGAEGGGLSLYDTEADGFRPVHQALSLPGDAIMSIQQDTKGNLWLASNAGLIRLAVPDRIEEATHHLYTLSDGLQDNEFNRNSAFTDINGEMFFGGHHGYNFFFPDRMSGDEAFPPVRVTDIKIYNQPWDQLPAQARQEISPHAPDFTEQIRLSYKRNNFNIEFAALGYAAPAQIKYAYRLEGFDPGWQYTDASRRFAYYNNLEPGEYTFQLKATNRNGIWDEEHIRTIRVEILPPPWKTGWAYLLYTCIVLLLLYAIYRFIRYRLKLTQALHLAEMEQAKRDEINHSKLMFFTNITHELLTPLTILSASVDEVKLLSPALNEQYKVMTAHINRLIRLLQQILEFRKAESGNLRLKVSQGDLVQFVRNSIESFQPLIKKKQMTFRFENDPMPPVYFDPDKWDKILYNLLSNAAKYNTPGSNVGISLAYREASGEVVLSVRDNGKGMSPEETKNLFKRFYEGDYRKFNTIGTGIGLSLTRDLVVLHHGEIVVESALGEGTAFIVTLPVHRDHYQAEEIDEDQQIDTYSYAAEEEPGDTVSPIAPTAEKKYALLLIEDNEDLLRLMVRLLSVEYHIFTAQTGKEGLEMMEKEEIDLVVSDIMMPEMDGIDFCKQVKSKLEISHIPVILLTAKNREEDRVEAYESGADGFLNKPFNLSILHARINNLLKAKERNNRDFKKQLVFEANELNYTTVDEEFLQRAIDLVHLHLDDASFDQHLFQQEMGTSKSTLYRKIKSLTGLNTSAFIRNIRMKAACRIMEEKKHLRISELAYAVGFNDPKYFSVCFKKEFGMQPSEYMERFVPEAVSRRDSNA